MDQPNKKISRFNFHKGGNYLMIFRDHVLEMFIQTDTPKDLEKYLRNILPNDYEEFLEFYSLPRGTHTSAYFLNLCDKDRDVFNMFKLAIPKFKKEVTNE